MIINIGLWSNCDSLAWHHYRLSSGCYKKMKKSNQSFLILAVLAMLFSSTLIESSSLAIAAEINQADARKLSQSGDILSLEKIIASAKSIKPGKVLETELEREYGKYVYEVELLDAHGQVWELKLDAKTGKLIKLESED